MELQRVRFVTQRVGRHGPGRRAAWLACGLVAAGVLAAGSAPALADTTDSSGGATRTTQRQAVAFFDPDNLVVATAGVRLEDYCATELDTAVWMTLQFDAANGFHIHANDVPFYLYRTTSPVRNTDEFYALCTDGALVSPPVGTGTVSADAYVAPDAGLWHYKVNGTYANADGDTCQVNAEDQGTWVSVPEIALQTAQAFIHMIC